MRHVLVPTQGNDPWSIDYQSIALPLSYAGDLFIIRLLYIIVQPTPVLCCVHNRLLIKTGASGEIRTHVSTVLQAEPLDHSGTDA